MVRDALPPKTLSEREAVGLAIKRLRKRADLTQEQAAAAMPPTGVQPNSWRRYEWGERGLDLQKLDSIARAIQTSREELLREAATIAGRPLGVPVAPADPSETRAATAAPRRPTQLYAIEDGLLPIRDRTQAGAWLRADDDFDQGEPRTYPAAIDPRYRHARQWLSEIVGDSVNELKIFEGDLAHLVDAVDIHYAPRTGDVVEVLRLRRGGAQRELTLKQVEVLQGGRVLLWPRSTNPRWREPLDLLHDTEEGEEVEVQIRALLASTIRRF